MGTKTVIETGTGIGTGMGMGTVMGTVMGTGTFENGNVSEQER